MTLPSADDRAADLVIGCVVDPDAVAVVARVAAAEDIAAAGCRADVVGLDQVPRRPDADRCGRRSCELAEMTLPAPATAPPMMLLDE